jgi:GT2 family glycosyltransferase
MGLEPVSVIMPVLGKLDFTKNFMNSFYAMTRCEYELIIINNGQDEETKQYLKEISEKDPKIKILQQEENLGVAKSWNLGVRESQYEYVCIVNNDIEIMSGGWLIELQTMIQNHPGVCWCSPTTCYTKDMKNICYRPYHYEQLLYGAGQNNYIVGCCFMIPKRIFDVVGYFDEQFDIKYYEDLDYINRIFQNVGKVKMANTVLVYHAVGTTSRETKGGETNKELYDKKWEGSSYNIMKMQPEKIVGAKHFGRKE